MWKLPGVWGLARASESRLWAAHPLYRRSTSALRAHCSTGAVWYKLALPGKSATKYTSIDARLSASVYTVNPDKPTLPAPKKPSPPRPTRPPSSERLHLLPRSAPETPRCYSVSTFRRRTTLGHGIPLGTAFREKGFLLFSDSALSERLAEHESRIKTGKQKERGKRWKSSGGGAAGAPRRAFDPFTD